jgi:hypothetical protein
MKDSGGVIVSDRRQTDDLENGVVHNQRKGREFLPDHCYYVKE